MPGLKELSDIGSSLDDSRRSVSDRVPFAVCTWIADDIRAKHVEFVDKASEWIASTLRLEQTENGDFSALNKRLNDLNREIKKGKGKRSQKKLDALESDLKECERIISRFEKAIQRTAALARQLLPEDLKSDDEDTQSACKGILVEGDIVERACDFYDSKAGREYLLKGVFDIQTTASVELDWILPVQVTNFTPRSGAEMHPLRGALSELGYRDLLPELFSVQSFDWNDGGAAFNIRKLALRAGQMLRSTIESVSPLGPYRMPPERWYVFAGTSPHEVGHRGQFFPDLLFRDRELVKQTNAWLDRLGIGYHLD